MTFTYKAVTNTGEKKEGSIDAPNKDLAIASLQRRGFIVVSIKGEEETSFLKMDIFAHVPVKDVVILSRQISTLFDAQVSALKAFSLLAANAENPILKRKLTAVTDDIQAGSPISGALEKHPDIFSDFYVNMVKAGEESGKLNQVFSYLAEYLDRQYALTSKTKNALIYPSFVIGVAILVATRGNFLSVSGESTACGASMAARRVRILVERGCTPAAKNHCYAHLRRTSGGAHPVTGGVRLGASIDSGALHGRS